MPGRKYYCDYCDKQFQDTPADRKRHARGIQHLQAKARWYDSFKLEQQHHLLPNPPLSHGLGQPLCFRFINTGFCRYGDSCKYIHPKHLPNATPNAGGLLDNTNMQQPVIMSMGLGSHLVGGTGGSTSTPTPGNVVRDSMGMPWGNLPPSLQPTPEGGYPPLPLVDWG